MIFMPILSYVERDLKVSDSHYYDILVSNINFTIIYACNGHYFLVVTVHNLLIQLTLNILFPKLHKSSTFIWYDLLKYFDLLVVGLGSATQQFWVNWYNDALDNHNMLILTCMMFSQSKS